MIQKVIYEHPSILSKKISTESNGFLLKYKKHTYFIGIHHGYPIKYVNINKNKLSSNEYNICNWNELLFKNVNNSENQFVFNKFSTKQIDSKDYYYCDSKRFRYIDNHYFPINMLPGNPKNLYYVMECINDTVMCGESGSPIYDKDKKLVGIISKIKKNYIYIIPTIYICNSIKKEDNTKIYNIKNLNALNINSYNIKDDKIYHPSLKTYINKDTYLVLEGDKDKDVIVDNVKTKYIFINNDINQVNFISINRNKIKITTGLLNILKLINKDLLQLIFKNFNNKESITFMKKKFIF
jgi:hypothetical protein